MLRDIYLLAAGFSLGVEIAVVIMQLKNRSKSKWQQYKDDIKSE